MKLSKPRPAYPTYLVLSTASAFLFSMVFAATSVYEVINAGLNPLQLVLIGTTLEASILLFEIPTGVVADIHSRKLSIVIGYILVGAGFILEGSFPIFWTILLAQVVWGLGYTFTSGSTEAWISDEIGEEKAAQAFMRSSQLGMVGGLVGLAVGIVLGNFEITLPIILGGALIMMMGLLLAVLMPETGFSPTPKGERSSWQQMVDTLRSGMGMLKHRPALKNIFMIGLFYGLYSEGFDRLWQKHLLDDFNLPAIQGINPVVWIGFLRITSSLLALTAIELVRRRLVNKSPGKLIRTLFGLSVMLIAGLGTFAIMKGNYWLALLPFWIIEMTRSSISPLYTSWVNEKLDPQVRATVLSMSGQVDAIGQVLAGPFMGMVGKLVSVRAALGLSTMLLTPILGFYRKALKEPQELHGDVNNEID
jgi:DHA3 family tetracycline resistance protein-like MFS transporter